MGDLTQLLQAVRQGEQGAFDRLFALLYGDLRSAAHHQLRRRDFGKALNTTLLVHESYLRLREREKLQPEDRQQFLAYAATVMRSVIIDLARQRQAEKRGGDDPHLTLVVQISEAHTAEDQDVVRIHEALEELAAIEPRLAKIVELRFFGGLSEAEAAESLGLARRTVQRDWEKARALLLDALKQS